MKKRTITNVRVLAIAPTSRGFGFAILEKQDRLMDWGVKTVKGDKNSGCLENISALIAHYRPGVLVFEDSEAKGSRRSPRVRALCKEMAMLMKNEQNVTTYLIPRTKLLEMFFEEGGTKHALAKLVSVRFPEELGTQLPSKRRAWMSDHYRMGIFSAVSFALAYFTRNESSF